VPAPSGWPACSTVNWRLSPENCRSTRWTARIVRSTGCSARFGSGTSAKNLRQRRRPMWRVRRALQPLVIECRREKPVRPAPLSNPGASGWREALLPFGSVGVFVDHLSGSLYWVSDHAASSPSASISCWKQRRRGSDRDGGTDSRVRRIPQPRSRNGSRLGRRRCLPHGACRSGSAEGPTRSHRKPTGAAAKPVKTASRGGRNDEAAPGHDGKRDSRRAALPTNW